MLAHCRRSKGSLTIRDPSLVHAEPASTACMTMIQISRVPFPAIHEQRPNDNSAINFRIVRANHDQTKSIAEPTLDRRLEI